MTDVDSGGGRKTRPRGRPRNNDAVVIDKTKSDVIDKTVTVEQNERESDDLVDSGKNEHDCVCEEKTWKGEQVLCCDKCNRWWHCSCAGLKGLDDAGARLLVPWLGPCCFVLNKSIQDKLGKVGIAEIVKDEVVKLIPDIVKRVVVEKDKVEGKKWTDFFNNKQNETKKVIKQTMSDNHQKVVKEALLESRKRLIVIIWSVRKGKRTLLYSQFQSPQLKQMMRKLRMTLASWNGYWIYRGVIWKVLDVLAH